MARPTTHADLSDYQRQGDTIFSWNYNLGDQPEVEQWIVKAKLEARKRGLEIGQTEVRVPKTVEALDSALLSAQSRWDNGEAQYAAVKNGHCSFVDLGYSDKSDANFYANCEGLPSVEHARDAENERLLNEANEAVSA